MDTNTTKFAKLSARKIRSEYPPEDALPRNGFRKKGITHEARVMKLLGKVLVLAICVAAVSLAGCSKLRYSGASSYRYGPRIRVLRVNFVEGVLTSHGSGVAIKHNGKDYLITAKHLYTDKSILSLYSSGRKPVPFVAGKVYKSDYDIIAVELLDLDPRVMRYPYRALAPGLINATGYPQNGVRTSCSGNLITVEGSCTIKSGMSGGPVIDEDGKLIGTLSNMIRTEGGEKIGCSFVPIDAILRILP